MIPASLVVVLTIAMAAGTRRMVERNVVVRNLKALESLGAVTDICSDKTGTLTCGKMVVKKAWVPSRGTYTVDGTSEPFNPTQGTISWSAEEPRTTSEQESGKQRDCADLVQNNDELKEYLRVASLANLAHVHQTTEGQWNARGDPTEIAIQVFATRFSWNRRTSTAGENPSWKMLAEFPFDSDVKKMSVLFRDNHVGDIHIFTKGAVERVITSCTSYVASPDTDSVEMTEDYRNQILENMESLAKLGLRVLALASRRFDAGFDDGTEIKRSTVENNLTFRGLIGLYDPPRPESLSSVQSCHSAGKSHAYVHTLLLGN